MDNTGSGVDVKRKNLVTLRIGHDAINDGTIRSLVSISGTDGQDGSPLGEVFDDLGVVD